MWASRIRCLTQHSHLDATSCVCSHVRAHISSRSTRMHQIWIHFWSNINHFYLVCIMQRPCEITYFFIEELGIDNQSLYNLWNAYRCNQVEQNIDVNHEFIVHLGNYDYWLHNLVTYSAMIGSYYSISSTMSSYLIHDWFFGIVTSWQVTDKYKKHFLFPQYLLVRHLKSSLPFPTRPLGPKLQQNPPRDLT